MGCSAGDACVHDHVYPHLRQPRRTANGYRALAPCHRDLTHSFTVSRGDSGRVIWHCFARCTSEQSRSALIRAGVPSGCLIRSAEDTASADDVIEGLVFGKLSHAHLRLRLAAHLRGYGDDLPGGAELAMLAESCGVSLREAYKARGKVNR